MKIFTGFVVALAAGMASAVSYPVVDTAQRHCYNDLQAVEFPLRGTAFCGQDAPFSIHPPSYTGNGDGTAIDHVTGLMWTTTPLSQKTYAEADSGAGMNWSAALAFAECTEVPDWPLPQIRSDGRPDGFLMTREDRNRDGKVSRDEFRGPSGHFDRIDRNRDGYITKRKPLQGLLHLENRKIDSLAVNTA